MKYLALLDNSTSKVKIIKLDNEDITLLQKSDDTLTFLYKIEKKYDFKESQCSWMITDNMNIEFL